MVSSNVSSSTQRLLWVDLHCSRSGLIELAVEESNMFREQGSNRPNDDLEQLSKRIAPGMIL